MMLILSWLINCQTQALHYLDSNDLRGFTDFINSEDVEAGGEDRDHWINAPVDHDGATLLEVAIKEKKAKFVETLFYESGLLVLINRLGNPEYKESNWKAYLVF